jgi:putative DNA primase/helicase
MKTTATPDISINDISTDELSIFFVRENAFRLDGILRKPGVWLCYKTEGTEKRPPTPVTIRISSPLYIIAVTHTENQQVFGRLLRFVDTLGNRRDWAMPMDLLSGSCEELLRELLAAGVEIEHQNRRYLPNYLQSNIPEKYITSVSRLGWTSNRMSFVFPNSVIGQQDVVFQNDAIVDEHAVSISGSFSQWQAMVRLCENNPVLILSVCVSLAGPMLALVHRDSGGVHLIGDSSIGKSTALFLGGSIWGSATFIRSWRATANGIEAVAALVVSQLYFDG